MTIINRRSDILISEDCGLMIAEYVGNRIIGRNEGRRDEYSYNKEE